MLPRAIEDSLAPRALRVSPAARRHPELWEDAYKNLTGKIGDKVVKKWFSDLRLLHMHENLMEARTTAVKAAAHRADGANDLLVGETIGANEVQVWFWPNTPTM